MAEENKFEYRFGYRASFSFSAKAGLNQQTLSSQIKRTPRID
jgi:hypothetical protein